MEYPKVFILALGGVASQKENLDLTRFMEKYKYGKEFRFKKNHVFISLMNEPFFELREPSISPIEEDGREAGIFILHNMFESFMIRREDVTFLTKELTNKNIASMMPSIEDIEAMLVDIKKGLSMEDYLRHGIMPQVKEEVSRPPKNVANTEEDKNADVFVTPEEKLRRLNKAIEFYCQ